MRAIVERLLSLEKKGYRFALDHQQVVVDVPTQGGEESVAVIEALKSHRAELQRLLALRSLIQQVGRYYHEDEAVLQDYIEDRLCYAPLDEALATFRQLALSIEARQTGSAGAS
jgi:hypothetical protein